MEVERYVAKARRSGCGVILTGYEVLRRHADVLLPLDWGYVALDEGHKISNPDAEITLICKQARAPPSLPLRRRSPHGASSFFFISVHGGEVAEDVGTGHRMCACMYAFMHVRLYRRHIWDIHNFENRESTWTPGQRLLRQNSRSFNQKHPEMLSCASGPVGALRRLSVHLRDRR